MPTNILLQDNAIKENNGIECLVLGGCRDVFGHGSRGKKLGHRWCPHLIGMAFVVKQNEAANPVNVSLLSTIRVMLDPYGIAHLVEPLSGTRFQQAVMRYLCIKYLSIV